MNTKTKLNAVLVTLTTLGGASLAAADASPEAVVFSGEITPKLYSFDYFKGAGADATQFLERYNVQKGTGDDRRSGFYLDADLRVVGKDAKRDVFVLERYGFGTYNHRGTIKADSDTLGFSGHYTDFRSATGGFGFLYNPNFVAGGTDPLYFPDGSANTNDGFVAQFNNDSPDQTLFKIDRSSFGAALTLKPQLFGTTATAALTYDGYKRDGNRFATYVLGGSDVAGANARVLQRWRGFDMPVDEKMNRYTVKLSGAPGGLTLAYDGSVEKFENNARKYTVADFAPLSAFLVSSLKPIHFVPDSTLISNNVRLAKNFGGISVAAGYGLSVLDQDSFSENQQAVGYSTGKITTNSAYLNLNANIFGDIGLEGFVKYYNRDNESTFPAPGLISATTDQTLGVRINQIKTWNYGLAATFRPPALKSTVTVGWKREDKDRDLTWTTVLVPGLNGIQPQRSLYREESVSDELYVNLVARPMAGVVFRLTPSYVRADNTGLVSEPEKAYGLKSKLSYAASSGLLVSGYFNYRNKKNATGTFIDGLTAPVADGSAITQDLDKAQKAAGVSANLPVSEWINTSASLSWMQDDFTSYYLRSNRRRFEAPNNAIAFVVQDRSDYNIDTYVLTFGGDWQATDALRWNGSYTYSRSKGNTASGLILSELPRVDGTLDNAVNSLELGVDYAIKKAVKFKGSYAYDYYKDKVYGSLTGGYHTLMLGVSIGY